MVGSCLAAAPEISSSALGSRYNENGERERGQPELTLFQILKKVTGRTGPFLCFRGIPEMLRNHQQIRRLNPPSREPAQGTGPAMQSPVAP